MRRLGICLSLCLVWPLEGHARAGPCHIHAPATDSDEAGAIIGPFPTWRECERERERRFGPAGRCHCRADFTPRWVPQEPAGTDGLRPPELL